MQNRIKTEDIEFPSITKFKEMRNNIFLLLGAFLGINLSAQTVEEKALSDQEIILKQLKSEVYQNLRQNILPFW
jgi:hypothetical protein